MSHKGNTPSLCSRHWLLLHAGTVLQGFASLHDDVIKWKHFPRYWPFARGIHRSPVNSPHKGQWRGALMFSLICVWINGWVNNHEAGDLRRYRAHYDVNVMCVALLNSFLSGQNGRNFWQNTFSNEFSLMNWDNSDSNFSFICSIDSHWQ